jgi:hypothetical protein
MALTSTTLVDVVNSTQTITFYESAVQVDQIVYANNQICHPLHQHPLQEGPLLSQSQCRSFS